MSRRLRLLAPLAALLAAGAAFAPSARAGTYDVLACKSAPGDANHSWVASNTSSHSTLETGDACTSTGTYGGLYARDVQSSPDNIGANEQAGWTFTAPAGLTITAATLNRWMHLIQDEDMYGEISADSSVKELCQDTNPDFNCTTGTAGGGSTLDLTGLSASKLRIGLRCAPSGAATGCAPGGHAYNTVLYGARVTVADSGKPSVGAATGSLRAGGWLRGTQTYGAPASDASGIASVAVEDDTTSAADTVASKALDCDFTNPKPCADQPAADLLVVDTTKLADGLAQITPTATDAAGNRGRGATENVHVDNHAPLAPSLAPSPAAGSWQATTSWAVTVTDPHTEASPITTALYRFCAADGSDCQTTQSSPWSGSQITLHVSPGESHAQQLQVWLEDQADNATPINAGTALLEQDTTPPSTPQSLHASLRPDGALEVGWTNPTQPGSPLTTADIEVCDPGCSIEQRQVTGPTNDELLAGPPPGTVSVRVWLGDQAGNTEKTTAAATQLTVPAPPPTSSTTTPPPSTTTTTPPPPSSSTTTAPPSSSTITLPPPSSSSTITTPPPSTATPETTSPGPGSTPPPTSTDPGTPPGPQTTKSTPRLRLGVTLRRGRVTVTVRAPGSLSGSVRLRVTLRGAHGQLLRSSARLKIRHGLAALSLRSPTAPPVRSASVSVRYGGSQTFAAVTRTRRFRL